MTGSLLETTAHLCGRQPAPRAEPPAPAPPTKRCADMADVRGQLFARRALEIAAAGGHNILLIGPPGTGKSMLAQRMPALLPPMNNTEALETAAVSSVLGIAPDIASFGVRPFRAPHHTASAIALVGGGSDPRPGEISRANNGVLFLDELPEFNCHVLEVLREPLESGTISIARAAGQADYPARFQLVAAMNPCPCGFLGDAQGECNCSADAVRRYQARVSGPLLDRIDIKVEVSRPPVAVLRPDAPRGEPSEAIAKRVIAARTIQLRRHGMLNSGLNADALCAAFAASTECTRLLERAASTFALSARGYQRIQRVAQTIADLAGEPSVRKEHVSEALALWRPGNSGRR